MAEIRAAAPAAEGGRVLKGPWSNWRALAVAAAVAFVAVGAWQLTRRPSQPIDPVVRGGSGAPLSVQFQAGPDGGVVLSWELHPEAQTYIVEILRSDGVSVFKREAQTDGLGVPPTALPATGQRHFVRIEARNAMGQQIAKSPLVRAPESGVASARRAMKQCPRCSLCLDQRILETCVSDGERLTTGFPAVGSSTESTA